MDDFSLPNIFLDLLDRRIIEITGKIELDTCEYLRAAFTRLLLTGSPDILVHITSFGGDVYRGLDVYDILRAYPGKKTGLVISGVQSMATIILQACDRRLLLPHATVMIHHPSYIKQIKYKEFRDGKVMGEIWPELQKINTATIDIIAERATGKTPQQIEQVMEDEKYFTADEAVAFGLADGILVKLEELNWPGLTPAGLCPQGGV